MNKNEKQLNIKGSINLIITIILAITIGYGIGILITSLIPASVNIIITGIGSLTVVLAFIINIKISNEISKTL